MIRKALEVTEEATAIDGDRRYIERLDVGEENYCQDKKQLKILCCV